jgi:hypothetical protein
MYPYPSVFTMASMELFPNQFYALYSLYQRIEELIMPKNTTSKWTQIRQQQTGLVSADLQPHEDKTAAIRDWSRWAQSGSKIYINGIQLSEYAAQYSCLHTMVNEDNAEALNKNLRVFLKNTLLQQIESPSDAIVDQLVNIMHQGGIVFPASESLVNPLMDKDLSLDDSAQKRVDIISTPFGFSIEEHALIPTVMNCNVAAGNSTAPTIKADLGNSDYVIKAHALIEVDCSNAVLDFNVKSNDMIIGNAQVAAVIGKRSLFQLIADFFKNMFNLSNITNYNDVDLSPKVKPLALSTGAQAQDQYQPSPHTPK